MTPNGNQGLVATLPNRFRARVPDTFNPEKCVQAVNDEWYRLAETVWDRFLAPIAKGNSTREIWERQTNNYWEISWVFGENPAVLEQRKNWRTYFPATEPGINVLFLVIFRNFQVICAFITAKNKHSFGKL